MSYAEHITAFENSRAAKASEQKSIMDEALAKGETLDAEGQEKFDTLQEEIDAIDGNLKRLRVVEKTTGASATEVRGGNSREGNENRGGTIVVKAPEKLAPGIALARLVKSIGLAHGDVGQAQRIAAHRYGEDSDAAGTLKSLYERGERSLMFPGFEAIQKTAVSAGSAESGNWAADLVLTEGGAFADFANFLRPATIIGKFGTNGIPALRRIPFNTALGISTSGGAGYWVGEGLGKGLTSFNVDKTHLSPLKCANIAVLTEDLLRSNSYSAETLVRDELVNALVQLMDTTFVDPTNSGTANVKPASITNGASHGGASGTGDATDIRNDLRSLLNEFVVANAESSQVVLVMRASDALAAGMLVNALGQPEFPGITMNGGQIVQLPVITSQSVPSGVIVAVQPNEIYLADDDGFLIDVSREASLEMSTAPTNEVNTPTAASLVSLWQTNSVGFRAERIINWARRRSTAVSYLTGNVWGGSVNDLS